MLIDPLVAELPTEREVTILDNALDTGIPFNVLVDAFLVTDAILVKAGKEKLEPVDLFTTANAAAAPPGNAFKPLANEELTLDNPAAVTGNLEVALIKLGLRLTASPALRIASAFAAAFCSCIFAVPSGSAF